jgi:hypothetical protein
MAYGTSRKTEYRLAGRIWESVSHERTLLMRLQAMPVSFDATYYRYVLEASLFPGPILERVGGQDAPPEEGMRANDGYAGTPIATKSLAIGTAG